METVSGTDSGTNAEPNPETSGGINELSHKPASEATTQPDTPPVNDTANDTANDATHGTDAPPKRTPRRQKAVIDRIEDGKYAVLLIGNKQVEKSIPVEQLPEGAKAGSWLKVRVTDDGVKDILVDEDATQAAQDRVQSKLEMLRNRPSYFQSITPSESQNGGIQPLNPSPSESQNAESKGSEWQAGSDQKPG